MSRHFLNEFIKLWVARNYYLERVGIKGQKECFLNNALTDNQPLEALFGDENFDILMEII